MQSVIGCPVASDSFKSLANVALAFMFVFLVKFRLAAVLALAVSVPGPVHGSVAFGGVVKSTVSRVGRCGVLTGGASSARASVTYA